MKKIVAVEGRVVTINRGGSKHIELGLSSCFSFYHGICSIALIFLFVVVRRYSLSHFLCYWLPAREAAAFLCILFFNVSKSSGDNDVS